MKHLLFFLLLLVSVNSVAQERKFFVSAKGAILDRSFGNVVKIAPEVGYNFNKSWAAGVNLGFEIGDSGDYTSLSPFVRWTFFSKNAWRIFVDGECAYYWRDVDGGSSSAFEAGLKPGVSYSITPYFQFVFQYAFLGYRDKDFRGNHDHIIADFTTDMIQLGVQFTF